MARVTSNHCRVCENKTTHINGKCSSCFERKERERIASWNSLTTEEKLQDLRKRVEKLERGPAIDY
jgi:predicted ATP-dependent serine protease